MIKERGKRKESEGGGTDLDVVRTMDGKIHIP